MVDVMTPAKSNAPTIAPATGKLGILMPGEREEKSRDFPSDTNMAVSGAILRFRDAAGVRWIRRSDGGLVEQR